MMGAHPEEDSGDVRWMLNPQRSDRGAGGDAPGRLGPPTGRRINERNLEPYVAEPLCVVYCAGPHRQGADMAAVRVAELGRAVKKMIGAMTGWVDEGFEIETGGA